MLGPIAKGRLGKPVEVGYKRRLDQVQRQSHSTTLQVNAVPPTEGVQAEQGSPGVVATRTAAYRRGRSPGAEVRRGTPVAAGRKGWASRSSCSSSIQPLRQARGSAWEGRLAGPRRPADGIG